MERNNNVGGDLDKMWRSIFKQHNVNIIWILKKGAIFYMIRVYAYINDKYIGVI